MSVFGIADATSWQQYKDYCIKNKINGGDERFCNNYASMNWNNDPSNRNS